MKKSFLFFLVSVLTLLLTSINSFTIIQNTKSIEGQCRTYILSEIDSIQVHLKKSIIVNDFNVNEIEKKTVLESEYHQARKHYKHIEFFIEYFSSFDAKYFINGPLVKKFDLEAGNRTHDPHGFQVIEESLFAEYENRKYLKDEYKFLSKEFEYLKARYVKVTLDKGMLLEMIKLQIVRVMSLNLSGYDCTISKENIKETEHVLNGLITVLSCYRAEFNNNKKASLDLENLISSIKKARQPLRDNVNADAFKRLQYIVNYLDPIAQNISMFHLHSGLPYTPVNYALNLKSRSLFSENSFNKKYFSLSLIDSALISKQIELGSILFFDPILSGNNKRACSSCHQSSKGLTDGLTKSTGFDMNGTADRNAPTLYNVSFQKTFFYDGRAFNLEEQGSAVLHNKVEMNTTAEEIVAKLRYSDEYKNLFRQAFKNTADTTITFYAVLKSLAEFERTLSSLNSRFDKYLHGDRTKLSAAEINGFNVFSGKALCGSCHFFPLFNGIVPPSYSDNEYEVIGVPQKSDNKNLDPDSGRINITHAAIHRFAFKTPTLRNVQLTAPYMHNGVYKTLEEVIDFYNKGGGVGLKFKLDNQTLPFDSLQLNQKEMNEIKSFLLALTDTSHKPIPPKSLPSFKNEALNKRKIGGEY